MPPKPPANIKLRDPTNADLAEDLLGEFGYGVPVKLASFTLEGHAPGRLGELFDVNHHPKVPISGEELIDQENIPFEEFTGEFWERMIERWDAGADAEVVWTLINIWEANPRFRVEVYRSKDDTRYLHIPRRNKKYSRWGLIIRTDAVRMRVTNLKAERKARQLLMEQLSGRQKRALELTGAFVEVGQSGLHYRISFNRPTLAWKIVAVNGREKELEFVGSFCLHPLGYYSESFAGCMPPSDEMLAHLKMIRADERLYWRKANQHEIDDPLGGL